MKTKLFILFSLITSMSFAQVNEQDSLALVALYNSTNGPGWDGPNGWLSEPVEYWWGVTIENGRVVEIRLGDPLGGGIGLTGCIPAQIGDLTHLRVLKLQYDNITGNIPSEIGNLSQLTELDLMNDQLTGSIPPEIGNLSQLNYLNLMNNELTGCIPLEIGNLTNLAYLDLSYNQLTDSIPPEIGNMTNLAYLSLSYNQLVGSIPPEIGNLSQVYQLWLSNNQLSGNIPPEIGSLSQLYYLHLSNNQLSGNIPPEIGNLSAMNSLDLQNNQLIGVIPYNLENATWLRGLYLSNNQLAGSVPSGIGNLTNLRYLYLTNNQLTGDIPDSIFNVSIKKVALNNNRFTLIPDLSNSSQLEIYKIENNRLEFDCIESNMSLDTIDEFTYSPQDSVNIAIDTTVSKNSTIQFNTSVDGTANQYQWYHNQIPISGAIDSVLTMNSVQTEDEGLYTCAITNSLVPDLTLWRRNIHLQVDTSNAINENGINTISVYIKNKQLIIDNINADCRLSIYTVQGNHLANYQLKRGEIFRKSLSNYPKSALLLVFYDKKRTSTRKIINR